MGWVQWLSFITGLIYIYYASAQQSRCWPWGIISSGLWAYASWFDMRLLSDSILQMIYVVLGIWGWYAWSNPKKITTIPVTKMSIRDLSFSILCSLVLSALLGWYMTTMEAAFPILDATLTIFSITATILLIQQKIENWLFWILIDWVSVPVFMMRGGYLFAILFVIYGILAIKGWYNWSAIIKNSLTVQHHQS